MVKIPSCRSGGGELWARGLVRLGSKPEVANLLSCIPWGMGQFTEAQHKSDLEHLWTPVDNREVCGHIGVKLLSGR